jgi:hypothetical protein
MIIYLFVGVVDIERDLKAEGIQPPTPYLSTAKGLASIRLYIKLQFLRTKMCIGTKTTEQKKTKSLQESPILQSGESSQWHHLQAMFYQRSPLHPSHN